jgi:hypothetical protein
VRWPLTAIATGLILALGATAAVDAHRGIHPKAGG